MGLFIKPLHLSTLPAHLSQGYASLYMCSHPNPSTLQPLGLSWDPFLTSASLAQYLPTEAYPDHPSECCQSHQASPPVPVSMPHCKHMAFMPSSHRAHIHQGWDRAHHLHVILLDFSLSPYRAHIPWGQAGPEAPASCAGPLQVQAVGGGHAGGL